MGVILLKDQDWIKPLDDWRLPVDPHDEKAVREYVYLHYKRSDRRKLLLRMAEAWRKGDMRRYIELHAKYRGFRPGEGIVRDQRLAAWWKSKQLNPEV